MHSGEHSAQNLLTFRRAFLSRLFVRNNVWEYCTNLHNYSTASNCLQQERPARTDLLPAVLLGKTQLSQISRAEPLLRSTFSRTWPNLRPGKSRAADFSGGDFKAWRKSQCCGQLCWHGATRSCRGMLCLLPGQSAQTGWSGKEN